MSNSDYRRINSPTAPLAGDTISFSTTETFFASQVSLQPNALWVRRTFKVRGRGVITTPTVVGLGMITMRHYLGSKVIASSSLVTVANGLTSSAWMYDLDVNVMAGGGAASSQLEVQGDGHILQAAGASFYSLSNSAVVTGVDLTGPLTYRLSVQGTLTVLTSSMQLRMLDFQATEQEN